MAAYIIIKQKMNPHLCLAAFLLLTTLVSAMYPAATDRTSLPDGLSPFCVQSAPNQGYNCSSGWAYAAAMLLRHRYCMKYGWNYEWELSTQQIVACAIKRGCEAGTVPDALNYTATFGLVSDMCYPTEDLREPQCKPFVSECPSGSRRDRKKIYGATNVRHVPKDLIFDEISTKGGVAACFNVYSDFYEFFLDNPKGIYPPPEKANQTEGVLCALLLGCVSRYDEKWKATRVVWILEGSLGEGFADKGFFMVQADCKTRKLELEDNVWAADPK